MTQVSTQPAGDEQVERFIKSRLGTPVPTEPSGDEQPMPEKMAAFHEEQQRLLGFMTNDEWNVLLGEVNELIQQMEALPEGETKTSVFRLLDGIDTIHREGLRRLVRLFKEGVLEQVITDPPIHTLLELYDLLPSELIEPPPEPAKPKYPTIPIRVLPAGSAPPVRYPHWVPALAQIDELPSGGVHDDVNVDGLVLLMARRNDSVFALDGQCPVDGASLRGAVLNGFLLSCPNHTGCHYDVRNGERMGGGLPLVCHSVKIDERGRVLVGLDMDFKPSMPSF